MVEGNGITQAMSQTQDLNGKKKDELGQITSEKMQDLIKNAEKIGWGSKAKKIFIKGDAGYHNATIGYGHLIANDEEAKKYKNGIDEATAQKLFKSDLTRAESSVHKAISVSLSQNQFDALVDIAFNIGSIGSRLANVVNGDGEIRSVYSAFMGSTTARKSVLCFSYTPKKTKSSNGYISVYSTGLRTRRAKEINIYYGRYPSDLVPNPKDGW